ncbi:hypothetical protein D9M69_456620 [compost metagenome]
MDHAHDYAELIIHQWQWPVDQPGTAQQPVQNAIIAQQQHPGKRLDEIAGPEGNEHQQKHLVSTVFFQTREPIGERISQQQRKQGCQRGNAKCDAENAPIHFRVNQACIVNSCQGSTGVLNAQCEKTEHRHEKEDAQKSDCRKCQPQRSEFEWA